MCGCHSPGTGRITAVGVDLATVDTHRAAEAGADVESGFDDRIPTETRQDRFEIADFPGQAAAGHSVSSSLGQVRGDA